MKLNEKTKKDIIEEAKNFADSLETHFMKVWVNSFHTTSKYILSEYPFMKDYSKPWNDERFYKYFQLSKEEINIIEKYLIRT